MAARQEARAGVVGRDGRASREGWERQKEESNWQVARRVIYLQALVTTWVKGTSLQGSFCKVLILLFFFLIFYVYYLFLRQRETERE